jgi:signal transduction histidine kinase
MSNTRGSGSIFQALADVTAFCITNTNYNKCLEEAENTIARLSSRFDASIYVFDKKTQQFISPTHGDFLQIPQDNSVDASSRYFTNRKTIFACLKAARTLQDYRDLKLLDQIASAFNGLIWFLYERHFSLNLFSKLHKPVDYHQDWSSFIDAIKTITADSSGMYAGAFREISDQSPALEALFAWHPDVAPTVPVSTWDISNPNELEIIQDVIASRKPQALSSVSGDDQFFFRPEQLHIKSAVFCPCLVGDSIIGILSFAQKCEYSYSPIEVEAFMAIANSIGVAITNFRRTASESARVGDQFANAMRLTAVEVAQAARHTARAVIDTANTKIARLLLTAEKLPPEHRAVLLDGLTELSGQLVAVTKALDDIKVATRPAKKEKVEAEISSLWSDVVMQLRGKLNKDNIIANYRGARCFIFCAPDYIKHLMLNLVINSIDSFSSKRVPGRKEIVFRYDGIKGNFHEFTYVDNANGFDVVRLKSFAELHKKALEEVVFEKDVTTKGEEGSGWGLYLCRRIMKEHKGSISVVDSRRGATFSIKLPANREE